MAADSPALLVTLAAVLLLGPLVRGTCRRFGLPSSVGYLLLGLAIGAVLEPLTGPASAVFDGTFATLAQLGVVALLFRVGLRSHTTALLDKLPDASVIWLGNVLGTLAVGYLVARYGLGASLESSLVVGIAFSATSIAVSMAVWDELGLAGTDAGQMVLDVAELDDLSAAVLLAVLLGTLPVLLGGDDGLWLQVGTSTLAVLLKLMLFMAGCYLFAHFVEQRFTALTNRLDSAPATLMLSILGAGLAIGLVAEWLGFSIAIGALFAGLAFSRDPEAVHTDAGFTYLYDFLTPFFFIHIGLATNFSVLIDVLDVGLVLLLAASASKVLFTFLPALLSMGRRAALSLGVSMVPRAEIALVVVYESRTINPDVVPDALFAGMVIVSLGTCVVAPVLLRVLLGRT